MNSDSEAICNMLMGQAWERAKGELAGLNYTSVSGQGGEAYNHWREKCHRRDEVIENFIKAMEDDELYQL